MKILIVDDSRLARASLIKTLTVEIGDAHKIMQASNGQEALELYKKESPLIVFLDLTMPMMDGFEVLKELKKLDSKVHVVIVSADVQPKAVAQVMQDGAIMHVQKPINASKMQEIIKTVSFIAKVDLHVK